MARSPFQFQRSDHVYSTRQITLPQRKKDKVITNESSGFVTHPNDQLQSTKSTGAYNHFIAFSNYIQPPSLFTISLSCLAITSRPTVHSRMRADHKNLLINPPKNRVSISTGVKLGECSAVSVQNRQLAYRLWSDVLSTLLSGRPPTARSPRVCL